MTTVLSLLASIALLAALVATTSFSTTSITNFLIPDAHVRTIVGAFLWGLTMGCFVGVIVVSHFTAK